MVTVSLSSNRPLLLPLLTFIPVLLLVLLIVLILHLLLFRLVVLLQRGRVTDTDQVVLCFRIIVILLGWLLGSSLGRRLGLGHLIAGHGLWLPKARGGSSGGGSSPNIRLFFSENCASQVRQGDGAASSTAHECTLLIPMN
jgi:hypothetical protein